MRHTWIALVLAVGCGKGATKGSAPAAGSSGAAAAAPAGGLTIAKVMGADHLLKPFEPWDQALATLQSALGPPSRIKHDALTHSDAYEWAAIEGDDCAIVSVGPMDGKALGKPGKVAGSAIPMRFKNDGSMVAQRQECVDAAKAAQK
jgi:hypothetical protein